MMFKKSLVRQVFFVSTIKNFIYTHIKKPIAIYQNKKLIKLCPFLDEGDDDPIFTRLDQMPNGWKKAFGKKLAMEIQKVIDEDGLTEFKTIQVKEKFGRLCWYYENGNDKIHKIIEKYEELSSITCVICGRKAKWFSTGWICPFCTLHKIILEKKNKIKFKPLTYGF